MFIDTHCHLSKEYYNDIDKVVEDNKNAGIEKMIISGCEKKDLDETIELINKYDFIYATIGYHPDQVELINDQDLEYLKELIINNNKIIGIGEIGLDYHYDKEVKEKQKELFRKQLKMAEELKLPVVIHSRDATSDTIEVLREFNVTGIIHCFSGSLETANIYIKMGYKLGIGGVLTFKNSKLSEVIENVGLENIVLETDSPYLAPEPFRGKQNSSKYIPYIAEAIAKIKNISVAEVSRITLENTNSLFDLNKYM